MKCSGVAAAEARQTLTATQRRQQVGIWRRVRHFVFYRPARQLSLTDETAAPVGLVADWPPFELTVWALAGHVVVDMDYGERAGERALDAPVSPLP